ncbi:MAG: hypothetical protein M4579_005834 [Chaenotheca gracillima]|nr:MAG: hypothetical protein M4579_005834 [Chaenotheca gracillima]
MESPASTPNASPQSGADLARMRRERREAKIKAGGSARLGKITSMSGRPAEAAEASSPATASVSNDPDEVDISQHFYSPASTPRPSQPSPQPMQQPQLSEEQLRQMMMSFEGPQPGVAGAQGQPQFPFSDGAAAPPPGMEAEDPMMKMLQQILGGPGGDPTGGMPGGGAGVNPSDLLSQMMGQGIPGFNKDSVEPEARSYAYIWRIVHALFAIVLGIYTISATSFTGVKSERARKIDGDVTKQFFWLFATGELILQSSRFFIERGGVVNRGGMLASLATMLPEPWKGRVAVALRYSAIYTTIMADAMVVIFMLGCVAWWNQS